MSNETIPPNADATEIEIEMAGTNTTEKLIFRRVATSEMVLVAIALGDNEIFTMVSRTTLLNAARAIDTDPEIAAIAIPEEAK